MNDSTIQTDDSDAVIDRKVDFQYITKLESKFLDATATAMALFDLIAAVGNDGSLDSLLDHTVCTTGIDGINAKKKANDLFGELQTLCIEGMKAQEVRS